jgi:hypothetical protein
MGAARQVRVSCNRKGMREHAFFVFSPEKQVIALEIIFTARM